MIKRWWKSFTIATIISGLVVFGDVYEFARDLWFDYNLSTQRVAGLGGDLAAGTTVPEIIFITSDLALVDPAVIAAAVDASNAAMSVEDIKNYAGYRSRNPLLNGPNGGPINNATDYRNDIERS